MRTTAQGEPDQILCGPPAGSRGRGGVLPWSLVRISGRATLPSTAAAAAGGVRSSSCLVVLPWLCNGFAPPGTHRSSGVTTPPAVGGGGGDHDGVAFTDMLPCCSVG